MFEGCFDIFDAPSEEEIAVSKSNSSLNTTNVDTPPTGSSIGTLPQEILAKIFIQILPPYRNDLREICRSWKNIIDTLVGTTLRIGTLSEFDPECELEFDLIPKYHSPSILTKVGIDHLLVGNLDENWDAADSWGNWFSHIWKRLKFTETIVPTPIPPLKNPGLVTLLSLFGKLSPPHFSQFLVQIPTIRIFSITFYSLENLCLTQLETLSQFLPHLEVLVIRGGFNNKKHSGEVAHIDQLTRGWDLQKILINILTICGNHFPKLVYANLQFIYGIEEGLSITKVQLQFLSRHSTTMKSFAVEYVILLNDGITNEDAPENHPELNILIRSLQEDGLPQLKRFRILPEILPKLPYSAPWSVLTKEQNSLTDFAIMGVCYKLEFLSDFLTANYKSLTRLFIWEVKLFDDATRSPRQLDFGIFNQCQSLKKLGLRGWTVSLRVKNVIHADQLPKSINHLDLRDMAIDTDNVISLALELPLLKILELHFIGDKGDMGMDLLTLRQIISLRRMKEVKIFRSLNGKLYSDGIFNGDTADPEQILEMPGGMIAFHIGRKGYYVNTPCSRFDE